jgi:pyruvyl transferase EpsI
MSQKIRKLYYKFVLYSLLKGNRQPLESISGKKRCFVFLAADYGNLGDVAITYAQEKFLQQRLPDYEIVDVPKSHTLDDLLRIKKSITTDDIITIVGGGNMGDMYFDLELLRLMVVNNFKNNRVISFPQTIDYSDSKEGRYLLNLSKRIYNSHSNITMCAR